MKFAGSDVVVIVELFIVIMLFTRGSVPRNEDGSSCDIGFIVAAVYKFGDNGSTIVSIGVVCVLKTGFRGNPVPDILDIAKIWFHDHDNW